MVQAAPNETNKPARRRAQSQSRSALAAGDDENAADASIQQSMCPRSGILREALTISNKAEIDTILERRQNEGTPPLLDADSLAIGVTTAGSEVEITPSPGYAGRLLPMTTEEREDAHADVFGRPSPDMARSESRLKALEREVSRLPKSDRRALMRALRKNPLLFVNCSHARMILDQDSVGGEDGAETFDAAAAARRLARYWERRRALFGDAACYAPGTLPEPVLTDYRRYYERTLAVLSDPDADEKTRTDAVRMIDIIHRRKVEALDVVLEEMEEDIEDEVIGNHDEDGSASGVGAADEGLLEVSARTMAINSSHELKLQFLQVENMIEAKAARRLLRYWETGLRLFGPALRERKSVTLGELQDCSILLELGLLRLMPSEDDHGRSILVRREVVSEEGQEQSSHRVSEERLSQLGINEDHFAKAIWYIFHTALERNSCQENGFVVVLDFRDITSSRLAKFRAYRRAARKVHDCIPLKCRAVHCLLGHTQSWWRRKLMGGVFLISAALKRRFVVHACSMDENLDELSGTFGIQRENLPVDIGGAVDEEYFVRWLADRRTAGI